MQELWIRYSTGDKIYTVTQKLGEDVFNTIFKIHVLKRCGATSKAGTKAVALGATWHLIAKFGENRAPNVLAIKQAEAKFGDLWYVLYTKKNTTLSSLPLNSFLDHIMSF